MRISDWSSDVCSSDLEELLLGHVEHLALARHRDRQAVIAEQRLGDALHAVLLAEFVLRLLHGARGAGDVGVVGANALTEDLHAAAGAGRFHHGGGEAGLVGELFRSEEHTSELQSLMRNSYAVFCFKKKNKYTKDD